MPQEVIIWLNRKAERDRSPGIFNNFPKFYIGNLELSDENNKDDENESYHDEETIKDNFGVRDERIVPPIVNLIDEDKNDDSANFLQQQSTTKNQQEPYLIQPTHQTEDVMVNQGEDIGGNQEIESIENEQQTIVDVQDRSINSENQPTNHHRIETHESCPSFSPSLNEQRYNLRPRRSNWKDRFAMVLTTLSV
jgi:hypothetical protein